MTLATIGNAWSSAWNWVDAHFFPWLSGWRTHTIGIIILFLSIADQYELTNVLGQVGMDSKTVGRLSLVFIFLRIITARHRDEQPPASTER